MKITIGKTESGKNIGFDLDTLLTTRLLIQANSGGGKSWLLRKLMEQFYGHIQVICIDPEGEFFTLREKFGYVLVGEGGETPADVRSATLLAEKLLELKASAVCDLYEAFRSSPMQRRQWVRTFLTTLIDAPRALWHPLIVIVDEAHKFCPQESPKAASMQDRDIIAGCKDAMIALATTGRKRSFCAIWATQRLAKLDKDASAELFNRLVGMTIEDVDVDRAADLMSVSKANRMDFRQSLRSLAPGQFYAFGRAITTEVTLVKVGEIQTRHPETGVAARKAEPPPMPSQIAKLLPSLADLPKAAEEKAQTVKEFQKQLRELKAENATLRKQQPKPTAVLPELDAKKLRADIQEQIERGVKARDEQWMLAVRNFQKTVAANVSDIGLKLTAATSPRFDVPKGMKVNVVIDNHLPANPRKEVVTPAKEREAAPPVAAPHKVVQHAQPAQPAPEGDGKATPAQQRILQALAEFEAIGREQVSKKWIAAFAGASHGSSSYTNNLGRLRSLGYIAYPAPGCAAITDSGRALVPVIEPPTTSTEMMERCQKIVSPAQGRILQVLHDAYPEALDKNELAERVSASPGSSSYTNNLGALRSAGMIDYPEQGKAKAASWLFLENE